nr:ribonuclease P protein component [Spelaeicoccus albus]
MPREHRLRLGNEFTLAFRRGRRCGSRRLVVHVYTPDDGTHASRVGFVVSKAVGNAVVRNRVKRRLRAAVSSRMGEVPEGALMVVRALPASARADFRELSADLDSCLAKLGRAGWLRR